MDSQQQRLSYFQQQQQQQQQLQHPHHSQQQQHTDYGDPGDIVVTSKRLLNSMTTPPMSVEVATGGQPGAMKRERTDDEHSDNSYTELREGGRDQSLADDLPESEYDDGRPLRRKRRVKGQKICGVCGDTAQSHNFGALTCETCKAFFRRNAFKQKELQTCVFNSLCTITKSTRRFCAPCRLKKCFAVGMDPELILDDDEKKARQNKRERDLAAEKGGGGGSVKSEKEKKPPSVDTQQQQVTTSTLTIPGLAAFFSKGTPAASPSNTSVASPGSAFSLQDGSQDSTGAKREEEEGQVGDFPGKGKWRRSTNAQGANFKHVSREELPWDMQLYWPLTVDERSLLTQLTSSYQTVTSSTTADDCERMKQWTSFCMEKAIFALEHSLRMYVQFARVVPQFQQLQGADQIAVLKASALQWYHIRQAIDFIPQRSAWVNAFGTTEASELAGFFGDHSGLREYTGFCESLKAVVKNDMTLYTLLHVLVLFDPCDVNIKDRIFVNSVKDHYTVLLKHYLESQFSFLHADRYMCEVIAQLVDLKLLSQSSLDFYKHFSAHFRPLIAEVLSD